MSTQVKGAIIGATGLIAAAIVTGFLILGPDPGPPGPPVTVTIYDRLGEAEYSESLNIKIDGKSEGDLVIEDRQRPEASMTVSLVPGTHLYEIQGTTNALAQDNTRRQFPVYAEGRIDVLEGDSEQSFEVRGTYTPDGIIAELQRI